MSETETSTPGEETGKIRESSDALGNALELASEITVPTETGSEAEKSSSQPIFTFWFPGDSEISFMKIGHDNKGGYYI